MSFTQYAKDLLSLDYKDNTSNQECPIPSCRSTDSLKVTQDKYYKCYKCGSNGTIVDLLVAVGYRKTISEAFKVLKPTANYYNSRPLEYTHAFNIYKEQFNKVKHTNHPAINYIKDRGWSIDNIEIGLALESTLSEVGFTSELLINDWGEYFTNRIIFPVYNNEVLVHLMGRAIDDQELRWKASKGSPPNTNYFYTPNKDLIKSKDYIFICEGISDTLSLYQLDVPVIGQFGINVNLANSKYLVDLLKSKEYIIFCYDYDRYPKGVDREGEYKSWSCMMPEIIKLLRLINKPAYYLPLPYTSGIKDINDWLLSIDYDIDKYIAYGRNNIKAISHLAIEMYRDKIDKHNDLWSLFRSTDDKETAKAFFNSFNMDSVDYLLWIN